jgi:phosphoglycerate dehydrogenase-like enzyme
MIRVGVEESVDASLLSGFGRGVEIVRVPAQPKDTLAVDFLIASVHAQVTRQQWPYLREVRVVQSLFAGVEALLKIVPREVTLCDARGVHDVPISEWIVGAVLAMGKFFPQYLLLAQQATWDASSVQDAYLLQRDASPDPYLPVLVDELAGKTVMILGYGSIGAATEARLAPFDVNLVRVARTARPGVHAISELDSLLPEIDILISILPGTSETRGLLDARRLALMKRGALFVNAGRGFIVDTQALTDALYARSLRAALDVVEPEPLPPDHPLWKAPNLLLTPHVAGDSPRFLRRAFDLATQQVERFQRGEALENVVTGEY